MFEKLENYHTPALYQETPQLSVGSQGQLGAFSEFRQFYGYGGVPLNKNNGIAFGIFISQEGDLISENRLDVSYWSNIELSKTWNFTLSGKIGLINQSLGATNSTAGANTFSPNIGISTLLSNKKTFISFSLNQIGDFIVQPLSQEIKYQQYFNSQVSHIIPMSPDIDINLFGNIRLAKDTDLIAQAKIQLAYKEMIKPAIGANRSGMIFSFSWDKIPLFNRELEATFSYKLNFFKPIETASSSIYQVHLIYNLKKD